MANRKRLKNAIYGGSKLLYAQVLKEDRDIALVSSDYRLMTVSYTHLGPEVAVAEAPPSGSALVADAEASLGLADGMAPVSYTHLVCNRKPPCEAYVF